MSFLTALSAIGTVTSFLGQQKAARAAEAVSEYNAKVAENEAVLVARQKVAEEAILRKNSKRLAATQRVATAASGIEMSGSPLQALADTYFNTELDALRIQYSADIAKTAAEVNAELTRAEGRARASALRTQSYTSLLGSAYQTAQLLE
jgi:hypothetical protein